MLSFDFQLICQKLTNSFAATSLKAACLMLLVISSGCVQKAQDEAQLEIKSVQPGEGKGVYNLVGSTNLPESSQITVAAVRYLRPTEDQQEGFIANSDDANINHSILARQIVKVKQGQWQANLNLWQVAPNGNFQEVWQAIRAQMKLTPEDGVMFIATYDPASQSNLSKVPKLEGKLLRFTNEGQEYLQANQILGIPLPEGKTTPPRLQPQDINGGWGNRYQIPPQPVASTASLRAPVKSSQTNANLSKSAFLR